MADRTVKIVLDATVTGLQSKLKAASASASEFGSKLSKGIEKNSAQIDSLSTKAGLLGAGLTGVAALAVKRFADFDQAISSVAATSAEAAASIDRLRAAALEAGARTVYSATEAASAIEELSKAGLSTADILGGGLDGALDLASAGALDLAEAAGYTSVALQQFKLGGDQAAHVADLLAAGAGKAMGDVSDLGQALKQGGLVAAQTGLSIEETTGALASFAQAGLLGSDAGTSLKTMLQRLTPQSAEARQMFERLGISAYDAQGNFVGLANFAGQLKTQMADLTPEARNAALSVMFGSDAVRAASVLYSEGATGIQGWISAVDDQGYAATVAATKLDNLKGDLEGLSGAFETALINMGEGANGPLRSLVQGATDAVNAFSDLPSGVQAAALAIVGGGGLALLGAAGVGKVMTATVDTIAAMKTLGLVTDATAGKLARGMGKASKAAVGAAAAIATIYAASQSGPAGSGKGAKEMAADLDAIAAGADAVDTAFSKIDTSGGAWTFFNGNNGTEDFAKFLDEASDESVWAKIDSGLGRIGNGLASWVGADIRTEWTKQYDTLVAYGDELATLASTDLPGAQAAFRNLFDQAGGTAEDGQQLLKLMPGLRDELIGIAGSSGLATDDATLLKIALGELGGTAAETADGADDTRSAIERLAAAQDAGTATTEGYTDALKELVDAQRKAAGIVLDYREAQRSYRDAQLEATEAIKENGATLDVNTVAGRANQAALDNLASSGWDLVDSMREQGASQEDLQRVVGQVRGDFLAQAEAMGMAKDDANALADQLGLIPDKVSVDVAVETTRATADVNRWITLNDGRRIKVYVDTKQGNTYDFDPRNPYNSKAAATGGAIVGPGTGTSDTAGLYRLSNGEHVWTAREVTAAGGHQAMFAMRAAVLGGIRAMATGGAVGSAERARDAARKAWESAAARARRTKKDADERAADAARDRYEDARDRLRRLQDDQRDTIVGTRRGTLTDGAKSSLSGAYGLVDQLREAAGNTDYSKSQRATFAKAAREAEAAFKRLYGQAEKVESKLAAARDRVQELSSIKASAASALAGGFSLGSVFGQKTAYGYDKPVTGKSILAGARGYANKLKSFAWKLSKVQKKLGAASGPILQEIVGLGVEQGSEAADAILSLSKSESSQLTSAYKDIEKFSSRAGETVTRGFYKGGLSAAEGVVDGLKKEADAIAREIETVAERSADVIRRALGLPPESRSKGRGTYGKASASSVSSTPRTLTPLSPSSSGSSVVTVHLKSADQKTIAELVGVAVGKQIVANPPRAIYAPTQREQARIYQDGKTAAETLANRLGASS